MPRERSGSTTPSGSVVSPSHTPWFHTRVLAAPISSARGLVAAATARAASLNGVVTERPRSGKPSCSSASFSTTSSQKSPNAAAWNGR